MFLSSKEAFDLTNNDNVPTFWFCVVSPTPPHQTRPDHNRTEENRTEPNQSSVEWSHLFTCPQLGFIYKCMFWNRSHALLGWNIMSGGGVEVPRGLSVKLAPLLVSGPRHDLHHSSLPTLHFPTDVITHSGWSWRPMGCEGHHLASS